MYFTEMTRYVQWINCTPNQKCTLQQTYVKTKSKTNRTNYKIRMLEFNETGRKYEYGSIWHTRYTWPTRTCVILHGYKADNNTVGPVYWWSLYYEINVSVTLPTNNSFIKSIFRKHKIMRRNIAVLALNRSM